MRSRRYKSFRSLAESVSELIEIGELNYSLRLIHDFVERIITEPLCTSQVYGSRTLDDLCQHIGKSNLARIKHDIAIAALSQPVQPVFVYIVTKLQKSGGHTRVIEDFIKARPEAQHFILSTELNGKSDRDLCDEWIAKQDSIVFEQAPKKIISNG